MIRARGFSRCASGEEKACPSGAYRVELTFGSDQDYTLRTTLRVLYEVESGSNGENVVLELRDDMDSVLVSATAPNGTNVGQVAWEVNLVPLGNLGAVRKIRVGIVDGGDNSGTGTVLFDDISVSSGTYSTCRPCHGEFVGTPYVALTDGETWSPDLHDVHRGTMLSFDCETCHTGANRVPVFIGSSDGGSGLPGIGCLGCHGREEDMGHDAISSGRAAGLNQHHFRAGVDECAKCHTDADPANYRPVGENVRPAYYFADDVHPAKPLDPCAASERFVSLSQGLDNDGDLLYEQLDRNCQPSTPAPAPVLGVGGMAIALGLLLALGLWRIGDRRRSE